MECCKHCVAPKRHPGCHGHCPEYIEERAELDKRKAAENEKNFVRHNLYNQRSEAVRRAEKRRGNYKRKRKGA